MPDLNRKFYAGKMNKDLDERLVPNGEYRDAMNVQVSTSDNSDVGSIQNLLGNIDVSSNFFTDPQGSVLNSALLETYGFYCVGSVTDDKNDRLYWMVSGLGIDFIAEYDYKTKKVSPIVVDIFQNNVSPGGDGRVLHFDKSYLITGINIIEDTLFWTDNNTEPKRIKISEIRIGTTDFLTHTQFYVPNPNKGPASTSTPFVSAGDLKHEHITVIRKGPQKPPTLEMKNTRREDVTGSGPIRGEITTTIEQASGLSYLFDVATGTFINPPGGVSITFDTAPDFIEGDKLVIESKKPGTNVLKKTKIIVEVVGAISYSAPPNSQLTCNVKVLSMDKNIDLSNTSYYVSLLQDTPLFEFVFPRFGCRYKYKDGEYSAFSPFSEVAFLPGRYDYLPKEGYNLAMVNTVRALGVCNFVDARSIPKDVVSIDILYKESNSPNVYSIKTVDKVAIEEGVYDSWNAISPTEMRDPNLIAKQLTYGYLDVEAEMIHSILPSNQLLRGWDNVPRKALAQEVIGNRLVYANYLQNYNVFSSALQRPSALYNDINYQDAVLRPSKNIEVDVKLSYDSTLDVGTIIPEQLDAGKAYTYKSAKTIKSLRTYQVGVVYIDEFGRETPVFSDQKSNKNTTYVPKESAHKQTKLNAQIFSSTPDFAKNFKFLIKETSSEYYNLAMDRWYFADDGNIWVSFPSSDRSKVDIETFLILKKAHESSEVITDLARYKILDIDNEAPKFIKTKRTAVRTVNSGFVDVANNIPIIMPNGTSDGNFPYIDGTFIQIHDDVFGPQVRLWDAETEATEKQFRLVSPEGASDWYDVKSWENPNFQSGSTTASTATIGVGGYWNIKSSRKFGVDMSITTPFAAPISTVEKAYANIKVEFIKKEEKNLPEFEGRFFVKILKDAQLQQYIIGYADTSTTYTSINQIVCQYINPMDPEVQAGGELDDGTQFYNCEKDKISIDNSNTTTGLHPLIGNGHGHYFWQSAGDTEHTTSESSGWFIDKIEAFRPFAYNAYYFDRSDEHSKISLFNSPVLSVPAGKRAPYQEPTLFDFSTMGSPWEAGWDDGHGTTWNAPNRALGIKAQLYGAGQTDRSWSDGWFEPLTPPAWGVGFPTGNNFGLAWDTPGPPATSVPGYVTPYNYIEMTDRAGDKAKQLQLIGDCTNYRNGQGAPHKGYLGHDDIATPVRYISATGEWHPVLEFAKEPASGSRNQNGRILPAVGVDQVNNIITLSYAGIGNSKNYTDKHWNGFENTDGSETLKSYFTHTAWGGTYVSHQTFIDSITTPGTIWRWKQDPSQVVYQTQQLDAASGHGSNSSVSQNTWNYNEVDYADWNSSTAKGVELFNYTKIQDYLTYHFLEIQRMSTSTAHCYAPRANWATQAIGNYSTPESTGIGSNLCIPMSQSFYSYSAEKSFFPRFNSTDDAVPAQGITAEDRRSRRWPMFTSDWDSASNRRRRYTIHAKPLPYQFTGTAYETDGTEKIGDIGPHFYSPTNNSALDPHFDHNGDVLTTIPATKAPGIRPDGMYTGRPHLTDQSLGITTIPGLKTLNTDTNKVGRAPGSVIWQILDNYVEDGASEGYFSQNPGVWETEPKEKLGLEIYHEVGQIYPTELNETNLEQFFGPIYQGDPTVDPSYLIKNSKVTCFQPPPVTLTPTGSPKALSTNAGNGDQDFDIRVQRVVWNGDKAYVWLMDVNGNALTSIGGTVAPAKDETLIFTRADGSKTQVNVKSVVSTFVQIYEVHLDTHNYEVTLPFFNAYSFGNGVESDRIRDDFNQVTIDNGPKVSAVLEEPYLEENRSSGLIYSGIYNSMSGVNNLNQFIQAEKITKDLNPSYGSIQKLFARNTDLVTFCEDKVFKILANKDALFNADGNANLTATENVLGQTVPFVGDYGISKNPESFAADAFRLYFTDRTRGNVLRLSQDGITSISDYGMKDWFNDNLTGASRVIGSFDDKKSEYNISLDYYNYESYEVGIIGNPNIGPAIPGTTTPLTYVVTNELAVSYEVANNMEVDDTIFGNGIPVGTTVVSKQNLGGGQWKIYMSAPGDNTVLGSYVSYGVQQAGVPGPVIWKTKVYSSKDDLQAYTLSYSDSVRGWPSFKSFYYENGLSLNNDYFTIKGGQLYQHHANDSHNTFYDEFAESSVEVLFNEQSGSVKSFQTLDYEGTQSKVTSDGGLNETSNSAEYWDNYDKLGWYVDNMFTDLQEAEPAEFKNKEGKWFSTVKGVATEWLDDGAAGNIDTKEFSYQGIDEASEITVLDEDGGYTSWDCQPINGGYLGSCCVDSNGNPLPVYPTILQSNPPVVPNTLIAPASPLAYQIMSLLFDNPTILVNNTVFEYDDGTAGSIWCSAFGGGALIDGSVYPNSQLQPFVDIHSNPGPLTGGTQYVDNITLQPAAPGQVDSYTANPDYANTTDHRVVYTNINYLVQWCSTYLDSNVFYLGMSFHDWYNAMAGSSHGGSLPGQFVYAGVYANVTNPCASGGAVQPGSFNCIEVQGLSGAYPNEAACLADPDSECNPDCQTDNDVTVHTVDAFVSSCINGRVSVEVYLAGNATSWSVEYFYSANDAPVYYLVDNNSYTHNGFSNDLMGAQGSYYAIVTDDLGCTVKKYFTIGCNPVAQPCSPTNPHSFNGPLIQNPQDLNNTGCWETGDPNVSTESGSITFINTSLVSPATSWGYELYVVINGNATIIASDTGLLAGGPNEKIDGLENGDYVYRITDDNCEYEYVPFTLDCTDAAAPCDPPVLGQSSTSTTMSTSNDNCVTDNSDGKHELLNVLSAPTGSYYTAYYRYDNSQYSSWPGFANSTIMGTVQGPFTSTTPIGANPNIVSRSGLSDSILSGNNYVIVVSNDIDFECASVNEFTINCDDTEPVDPCVGENNVSLGPKVTGAIINATSYDCDAASPIYVSYGSHTLTTVQTQPAAQGFTVEYFSPAGFNITAQAGGVQSFSAGATMVQANGHDFLMPGGPYTCVITDNLGCSTTITFVVKCEQIVGVDPTYDCNNGCNPSTLPISTAAPFTIFSSYAACIASDCYTSQVCTGQPWVGCCDYVQNTGQAYPPSPSVGDSGPNIDPVTGVGKSCYEDPCCDCCGENNLGATASGLYPIPHPSNQNYLHQSCQGAHWDFPNNTGPICVEPNLSCFTKNDSVEMFDGALKPISEIKIGDEVKSIKNGKTTKGIVTESLVHPFNNTTEVVKINGITAEPYHPVYIDGKWIPIKELGETTYQFIDSWYNLEIDGNIDDSEHNYIIGGLIASGLGDNERLNNKYKRQPKQIFNL